jgi:hypothetical protein
VRFEGRGWRAAAAALGRRRAGGGGAAIPGGANEGKRWRRSRLERWRGSMSWSASVGKGFLAVVYR